MQISKDDSVVLLQETVLITPTHIHDQQAPVHTLSHIDLLNVDIPCYFPVLYFFRSGADTPSGVAELIASLKRSLAATLDLYPVVAGRFQRGERGLLQVEQNGAGVEFTAAVADASLNTWEDLRFCPLKLQLVANKPFLFGDMMIGAPLMCVQVTTFQCGGLALGVSMLHGVADLQSIAEFVEAWASLHRDPSLSLSLRPSLDSAALIRPRNPPSIDAPLDALLHLSGAQQGSHQNAEKDVSASSAGAMEAAICTAHAVFRISDTKVAEVVREVEAGEYSYGRATSFEAIAALLWVGISRARALSPESTTCFALPVNMRQRWRPPLPARFFGNAALPAAATARTQDIVGRHLSYAARLIHESISAADADYAQCAVDWLELQLREHGHVGFHGMLTNGQDLHASVMTGFPLYDLDFGWGHTTQVSLPIRAQINGAMAVMASPKGGRSRDLVMWLKIEHLKKLMANPLFAHYLEGEEQFIEELIPLKW